tara:strand:- start:336 stop:1160 length:825 start_codon:yes stop_codon:yes gene_type:complete
MTFLSSNQLKEYNELGFLSPLDVISEQAAKEAREEVELIEKKLPSAVNNKGRYNVHLISPKLDKIVHNSKILDIVESTIGKNILVCSTTLFIKNPNELGYVSFHQDAKYIGLEPHNWVTAWIALTDSNEENGCMKMWPGSHDYLRHHNQKFDKGNLLTRGQTVENIPEHKIKNIILKAGQMSIHHPKIVHGSGLNKSNNRRIGFVVQSYIGSNVKQVLGKNSVQIARGIDSFNYHKKIKRVSGLMKQEDIELMTKENRDLQEIFYNGSEKIGQF